MFKNKEYKLLEDSYFKIKIKESQFIEFTSVETGHCWNIFLNQFDTKNRFILYHKESNEVRGYKEFAKCSNMAEAISYIKEFDLDLLKSRNVVKVNKDVLEKRKLKVYESSGYKYKPTSTIILKGEWLKNCGFETGTNIEVECSSEGELIIRKIV